MVKNLFLIRHGEVNANSAQWMGGGVDQSLNDQGKHQVKQLKMLLKVNPSTMIYVSPLKRAVETASALFPSAPFEVRSEFAEINHGDFNEWEVSKVHEVHPQFKQHANNPDLRFPNGDSLNSFFSRVVLEFEKIQTNPLEQLYLVSHGGVINVLLHSILGMGFRNYPTFAIPNASITHLSFDETLGFYRLNFLGKTACVQ